MKDKKGGNFRTKASLAREEKEACKEGVPGEEDEEGKAGHNDETAFTKKAKDANIFFSDMDLLARILSFLAADDLWGCARTNRYVHGSSTLIASSFFMEARDSDKVGSGSVSPFPLHDHPFLLLSTIACYQKHVSNACI